MTDINEITEEMDLKVSSGSDSQTPPQPKTSVRHRLNPLHINLSAAPIESLVKRYQHPGSQTVGASPVTSPLQLGATRYSHCYASPNRQERALRSSCTSMTPSSGAAASPITPNGTHHGNHNGMRSMNQGLGSRSTSFTHFQPTQPTATQPTTPQQAQSQGYVLAHGRRRNISEPLAVTTTPNTYQYRHHRQQVGYHQLPTINSDGRDNRDNRHSVHSVNSMTTMTSIHSQRRQQIQRGSQTPGPIRTVPAHHNNAYHGMSGSQTPQLLSSGRIRSKSVPGQQPPVYNASGHFVYGQHGQGQQHQNHQSHFGYAHAQSQQHSQNQVMYHVMCLIVHSLFVNAIKGIAKMDGNFQVNFNEVSIHIFSIEIEPIFCKKSCPEMVSHFY